MTVDLKVAGKLTVNETIDVFAGQSGGWSDIIGTPKYRSTGLNIPTLSQISATPFWALQFAVDDWAMFEYHINHDFVLGSALYPHVHWLADGTNVNTVKWQFEIAVAKGHAQGAFNFGSATTLTVDLASPGQYYHMISEIADPGFSSANLEVDSIVLIKVTRITNGATENTDDIFMLMSDLHYKSNGSPTKNKAPNFYT